MRHTRREVLAGIAAATICAGFARRGFAEAGITTPVNGFVMGPITPFPMTQVKLLPGEVQVAAEINQKYLDSLATDRLLHSFRRTAGITSTATPYGGW